MTRQRRQAWQEGAADAAPRRRRLRRAGRGVGMPELFRPARLRHRRHIHFIINNQIGFTTSPQFGRSSPYPSDVAKGIQAPILHVNGDDPEAVTFCCKLATEFRQTFGRDVVIDMWCYRRFGHNEGDEPSFTQPLMYAAIKQHPPISEIYGKRLIAEGVVDQAWIDQQTKDYHRPSRRASSRPAINYEPNKADWFGGRWAGLGTARRAGARPAQHRHRDRRRRDAAARQDADRRSRTASTIHKTLQRILDAKKAMFDSGEGFDWATAEALAFGSLVARRLSASACRARIQRPRHLHPAPRGVGRPDDRREIYPAAHINDGEPRRVSRSATARLPNSACSASNMAIRSPTRRRWCCGKRSSAISPMARRPSSTSSSPSGEAKWLRASGLVMLLPHGYRRAGAGT